MTVHGRRPPSLEFACQREGETVISWRAKNYLDLDEIGNTLYNLKQDMVDMSRHRGDLGINETNNYRNLEALDPNSTEVRQAIESTMFGTIDAAGVLFLSVVYDHNDETKHKVPFISTERQADESARRINVCMGKGLLGSLDELE